MALGGHQQLCLPRWLSVRNASASRRNAGPSQCDPATRSANRLRRDTWVWLRPTAALCWRPANLSQRKRRRADRRQEYADKNIDPGRWAGSRAASRGRSAPAAASCALRWRSRSPAARRAPPRSSPLLRAFVASWSLKMEGWWLRRGERGQGRGDGRPSMLLPCGWFISPRRHEATKTRALTHGGTPWLSGKARRHRLARGSRETNDAKRDAIETRPSNCLSPGPPAWFPAAWGGPLQ
jgi:hypothetical protein